MKKILLVLAMIAASVFLAQPSIADGEGDTTASSESTPSETTEEILVEEPAPVVEQEPAPTAPVTRAPVAKKPRSLMSRPRTKPLKPCSTMRAPSPGNPATSSKRQMTTSWWATARHR